MAKSNVQDIDLYAILDIQINATESEIKKAYRKKALQCHPDKNPDNAKAAETFHELSRALEVLTDKAAREAYDKVLRVKAAAKLRHQELDSKRRKLKEDLDRREREATLVSDEKKLAAEIERLRKEGSRLLEEEQQRLKEELDRKLGAWNEPVWDSTLNRIKIKWKADKSDPNNGGYNECNLKKFLKKYGEIIGLIISKNKNGFAIVEFATKEASEMALEYEKGLPDNPLTLKWVNEKPVHTVRRDLGGPSLITDRDYEPLAQREIRQAAERKKLIEEMMKEDK